MGSCRAWKLCAAGGILCQREADIRDTQQPFNYLMERINALNQAAANRPGSLSQMVPSDPA